MAKADEQLSVAQAAKIMRITPKRVRDFINAKRLPALSIGRVFILKRSDVLAFKPNPRGRPAAKKK